MLTNTGKQRWGAKRTRAGNVKITPTQDEQNAKLKTKLARRMIEEGWTKTLPPDPEEMNELRAGWGGRAYTAFVKAVNEGDDEEEIGTNLTDLLCDLMHWADRQRDVSFGSCFEAACTHYDDETRSER